MARPTSRKTIGGAVGAGILALALLAGAPAHAQGRSAVGEIPALLSADEVVVDDDLGLVTAQGHVEISQGERLLKADQLTFNRRANVVTASGNVTLVEPTGEVIFSDFIELTSDLRDGIMRNLRLLIADQSRFAAVTARRADGSKTVMRKATYSPCEPCREDPTRAPVWQIRAKRITHDQEAKEVVYDSAWLEIGGVPIAYTPYLSHPDGTESRKSGFLIPEFYNSSVTGAAVTVPYYYVISPSADVTVAPTYQNDENPLMLAEYRQRVRSGNLYVQGAWLNASQTRGQDRIPENRGNVRMLGRFDIDDDWRWGIDAMRASDKTFLDRYRIYRRFQFVQQDSNMSQVYTEGFRDRSYAILEGIAYQSLRPEDNQARSPIVLPSAAYNYVGEPNAGGGYWSFDASGASIHRYEGVRTSRATVVSGYTIPHTTSGGSIYKLALTLQTDVFQVSPFDAAAEASRFRPESSGYSTRAMPQIALDWRQPFSRVDGPFRTTLEPIAGFYVSPNMGSQREFPNEESRTVTFDETNLFRSNRFNGRDRLESGVRMVYGINSTFSRLEGGRLNVLVGQQYRPATEQAMPVASGLDTYRSDIVGRVIASPIRWFSTGYRFQASSSTGKLLRQSTSVTVGSAPLQLVASYVEIDRALQPTALRSIRQAQYILQGKLDENWSIRALAAQSFLSDEPGLLYAGGALVYQDDCFFVSSDVLRRNIGRADVPSDTSVFFRFGLRNIGLFGLRGL